VQIGDRDDLTLVGRGDERELLSAFVNDDRSVLTVCLIDGSPGTGKTTLFDYALRESAATEPVVLRALPVSAESALPYVGLNDLLAEIDIETTGLPVAQAKALGLMVQREPMDDRAIDAQAVGRALVSLFRALALDRPLLIAIDDVQWLDAPSSRAMLFALRRVQQSPIRLIMTRRSGEADEWREALWRAVPEPRRRQLRVGPMSIDEISQLLRIRLDLNLSRPALVALHRRCEGNPLHALELGRIVGRGQSDMGHDDSADDLTSLLRMRVRSLSERAQELVVAAALASRPTVTLLGHFGGQAALIEACAAQVLEQDDGRVRFVHPLLASVSELTSDPASRRSLHAALADLVDEPDEAALHRARGTEEPSEAVAASLERSAQSASARGAPEVAAELADYSARLTPEDQVAARRRRQALAAEFLLAAGDPVRARQLLEGLVREMEAGPERADALWRLADAVGDDLGRSIQLSERALVEAGGDLELQIAIHLGLATFTWLTGLLQASAQHCRDAVALAENAGNLQLLAVSLAELVHAETVLGVPVQQATIDRLLELERDIEHFPPAGRPSFQLGIVYSYTDRVDEARPLFEAELQRVEASGDENARVAILFRLGELELRAGNWSRALRVAREAAELAAQAGIEQEQCVAVSLLAAVMAHLGRLEEAVRLAMQAMQLARDNGDQLSVIRLSGVLGFVALTQNDLVTADSWLAPALADIERMQIGELSIYGVIQNQLEVLLGLERRLDSQRVIELLEARAGPQKRQWHLAVAARGRAVLAASDGDEAGAMAFVAQSLEHHREVPQPFELARTLLTKGLIERRLRKRAAARQTLTGALAAFDTVGAAAWAERAAAELARISGRVSAGARLTSSEMRVAELVADGLSNSEVAARLFVSVRTVEAHLSHVYEKLSLRSRVDVARWMTARQSKDEAP